MEISINEGKDYKLSSVNVNKKKRNSSFELLRIIAMILIVTYHYSLHGGFDKITPSNVSINNIFIQVLLFGGKIGCYLFMFITGYFMIYGKLNCKKVFRLFLELEFYSLLIFFIINFGMNKHFSKRDWIRNALPIVYGNWFVVNYIMLYCFIPFINKLLLSISRKELKKLIILTILIYSIIPSITYYIDKYQWVFSNFDFMLVSYLIGAYIRINGIPKFESKKFCLKMITISYGILILLTLLFDLLGIKMKKELYIWMATVSRAPTMIFLILISIAIFYIFKNNSFYSRIINFIAPSMLGIYLIHDNELLKAWYWKEFFPNNNYLYSNYLFVHFLIKVIGIFIVSLIIDLIRRLLIEKPCSKIIDKGYEKIKGVIHRVYNKLFDSNGEI